MTHEPIVPKLVVTEQERPPREPRDFPHFAPRLRFLALATAAMLLVFLAQLAQIQLVHGARYAAAAESSMFRPERIAAPRGLILDRHGTLLASNRVVFDVSFSRVGLTRAEIDATLGRLAVWFPSTVARWQSQMAQGRRLPRRPQTLARGLTMAEAAPILERLPTLPGVTVREAFQRHYPVQGAGLGHVLGYVRDVNPSNLRTLLRRAGVETGSLPWDQMGSMRAFANALRQYGYELGDAVGVQGLELAYEQELRGIKGRERILTDAHSQELHRAIVHQAEPGHTLRLTLDLDLQRHAVKLLGDQTGAIVAMDARTGAILAMVSSPHFDSDQPMTGRGWADVVTNPARPLVNRAMREVYNPGSTLKPLVAMGALAEDILSTRTHFSCSGRFPMGGFTFRCDNRWGCGSNDVRSAIRRSCNIFFYNTMYTAGFGQRRWERVMRDCGLFGLTGIDLPGESPGHLPGRDVYPGEVIQLGIGQGPFDATPLQMVTAYARLGSNRRRLTPHLVERVESVLGKILWQWTPPDDWDEPLEPLLTEEEREVVLQGMLDVTQHEQGTGRRVRFPRAWNVAGKTGTAQNRGLIDAWFIGFAPVEDPKIVVGCVVEGGGHGADTAAPLVREMMGAYFYPGQSPLPAGALTPAASSPESG